MKFSKKDNKNYAFAVFEPAIEGGYNVSFPSFPGCVTFGKSFEEAQKMAQEVLSLWIEELDSSNKKYKCYFAADKRPIVDLVSIN